MTPLIKVLANQLAYEVPDAEKDQANKALRHFDYLLKNLKQCADHLDLIYTPFKNNQNVSPEEIIKSRAALRRFRDKVADNFNYFKKIAFRCFILLRPFSSDTQIIKLNKSFVVCIGDIQKQVNRFIDLFSNLESKTFAQDVVQSIDNIKKEIVQLEQIVEDRIMGHIENNILAKDWTADVSKELNEKIEQKVPQSIQLVEERNKKYQL